MDQYAHEAQTLYSFLMQDRIWIDVDDRVWSLMEMTPAHRADALRYLRRNAVPLVEKACTGSVYWWDSVIAQMNGEAAIDDATQASDDEFQQMQDNPLGWLDETPLVRRLQTLVDRDDAKRDRKAEAKARRRSGRGKPPRKRLGGDNGGR